MSPDLVKRLRDALAKAAGEYGEPTPEQRNEWMALVNAVDERARSRPDERLSPPPLAEDVFELVIGPWTFTFDPDGDDPGVGNLTIHSSFGNPGFPLVSTTQDDVQRIEWDAFVLGATL